MSEYQLLRLAVHGDRREFRAMTGGVIHTSGGAEKNAVAFQPEKVGKRIWKIAPAGPFFFFWNLIPGPPAHPILP